MFDNCSLWWSRKAFQKVAFGISAGVINRWSFLLNCLCDGVEKRSFKSFLLLGFHICLFKERLESLKPSGLMQALL